MLATHIAANITKTLNKMKFITRIITAGALAAAAVFSANAAERTELYGQRASLFSALTVNANSIVMLGNSLTHGCEWHELLGMSNVLNRGINGDTTDGIYDRLESILPGKPAKIFLLCGVNDVSHNLSANTIAASVLKIVDRIRTESPTTKVYLQSLLPINNSFGRYRLLADKEQVIRDINVILAEEAAKRPDVTWLNINPHFCDADGNLRKELTNDGLHLLAPGYEIWRELLLPHLAD